MTHPKFTSHPNAFTPAEQLHFTKHQGRIKPLIAIVGCDGSGKSTLATALLDHYSKSEKVSLCHLGKQGGHLLKPFVKLPFFGHKIKKRADVETRKDYGKRPIFLPIAIFSFLLSMRRVARFKAMERKMKKGQMILTDRFPQVDQPGPMDGLMLKGRPTTGPFTKALAHLEERIYKNILKTKPDLVIALHVDYDTAVQRKPDHRPRSLERKIKDLPFISFQGAPILELSAQNTAEKNVSFAVKCIDDLLETYSAS